MSFADLLKKARQPILDMMTGSCDVFEYRSETDPKTHVTKQKQVQLYSGQPCKLSYTKNPVTTEGDAPGALLSVRLILPSDLVIRAGCVFIVTQAGKTRTFKAASEPAVYTNHQEVDLESAEDYA